MATENVLDSVDRIEAAVSKFERILYGDPPARPNGLLVEFEGLRRDVQGLRDDVHRLQNKRPNVLLWLAGYLLFLSSGAFAIIGFVNQVAHSRLWELPPAIAFVLAIVLAIFAAFLLAGGYGWLSGQA